MRKKIFFVIMFLSCLYQTYAQHFFTVNQQPGDSLWLEVDYMPNVWVKYTQWGAGNAASGANYFDTGTEEPAHQGATILEYRREHVDNNGAYLRNYWGMTLSFSKPVATKDFFKVFDIDGNNDAFANREFVAVVGEKYGTVVIPTYTGIGSNLAQQNRTITNKGNLPLAVGATVLTLRSINGSYSETDTRAAATVNFGTDSITKIHFIFGIVDDLGDVANDQKQKVIIVDTGFLQYPDPLPIELVTLKATPINNQHVQIDWKTASELNNKGFEVQKSADNITWSSIAWVDGYSNSSEFSTYQIEDYEVDNNIIYYYRLKQIDYDERYSFSYIVSAKLIGDDIEIGNIYPNPGIGQQFLPLFLPEQATINLSYINSSGQEIKKGVISNVSGYQNILLEDILLDNYFLSININEKTFVKKVIK